MAAAKVAAEVHGHSIELGASGAANMLQAHRGICALLSHTDDPGLGYYAAAMEAGRTNPNEFLIASCDGTEMAFDKIVEERVFQATWSYLFPYSAAAAMRDRLRALQGEVIMPTCTQIGRLATKDNVAELRRMCDNPGAHEHLQHFSDSSIMTYSDTPLTTPER